MKIIAISGTPGTGKTSVSRLISNMINAKIITLNELVIQEKLTCGYDDTRDTSIIDKRRLLWRIKTLIKRYKKDDVNFLIIESHFSDILPNRLIHYAIVLRCDPDELFKRLEKRGYKKEKIIENVQSEILGSCGNYFLNKRLKKPVLEVNTTGKNVENIAKIVVDLITESIDFNYYKIGKIDWLEKLNFENRLTEYFN